MILKNVKFCSYINTIMRKSIDWLKDEKQYRDLGLTWMAHGNAGNFIETHPSYNKKDEWLNGSPDVQMLIIKQLTQIYPLLEIS